MTTTRKRCRDTADKKRLWQAGVRHLVCVFGGEIGQRCPKKNGCEMFVRKSECGVLVRRFPLLSAGFSLSALLELMAGRLAYGIWYVFSAGRSVSAARKNGCEMFVRKSERGVLVATFFAVAEYVLLVRSHLKHWIKAACDSFFNIRRARFLSAVFVEISVVMSSCRRGFSLRVGRDFGN